MIPGIRLIDDILRGLPENSRLRDDVVSLKTNLENSMMRINELQTENKQLRSELGSLKSPNGDLPEDAVKMLKFLAEAKDSRITEERIISHVGLSKGKGELLFGKLRKLEFVDTAGGAMGVGNFYYATDEGLGFLDAQGLL